ncbi:MAG: hypothetical protein EBT34_14930 [Acetobacteraceae bacterium]|nr:hypothetical protein [Acetobacteraceae bacterium]
MSGNVTRRSVIAGVGGAGLWSHVAQSQSAWPSQPIRLVVPFAPGGTTDLVARLVGAGLQERLGVSVIIENRAGAGATLGSETVARAAPDGYTLVMSNIASHAISPAVYGARVRYDAVKDFAHIALVVSNPTVWVANPRAGIRNLADVAARAKAPGGLQVATSGAGSSNHLVVVQMGRLVGTEITHVPFRGAGPAMQAVLACHHHTVARIQSRENFHPAGSTRSQFDLGALRHQFGFRWQWPMLGHFFRGHRFDDELFTAHGHDGFFRH